ncbi:MAG TPA: hypothetical protein DEQ74_01275, partial [Wolbachia sp.]|nr:hypothetical protein [Wolbachia sp.]
MKSDHHPKRMACGVLAVDKFKNLDKYSLTEPLKKLLGLISRNKATLSLEGVEKYIIHNDLSKKLTESYWTIDKNHDLLFSNHLTGDQLANHALLLTNTGFLTNMLMIINNNKLDRTIAIGETTVDRNYNAIRNIKNKVDRNLEVRFKILERSHTNVREREFKEVIDFVKHTKIEEVTAELVTFIKYFVQEKDAIKNLTHDQYITKLEEINSTLHRLQNSRMPQSGSLHTSLYNIIDQKFAIPKNSDDKIAFTALGLLYLGTEIYISVMFFVLEEYSYLADVHYQQNDLEKYNHYFYLISTILHDFKNSLAGADGLIDGVINVLHEVKSCDFIKDEREDIVNFTLEGISSLNSVKSKLATMNHLSHEKPTEKIKYNFADSLINTPIGNWEDRRKVSYAVQFHNNGTYSPIGEWSMPYTIRRKANPSLYIGTDPQRRTRIVFRKFDNDTPELVGIVDNSEQKDFRDIDKDLYNASLEPNEDVAAYKVEILLANWANVHARYENGRQAIHAAAESGSSYIVSLLRSKGASVNARDVDDYAPIHVAAEAGHGSFIRYLTGNGATVNAKTNLGETALHIAAENGHANTASNLMKVQGTDVNAQDQEGYTPLHTAASFDKSNVIIALLRDSIIDINAQSKEGFTPLHLATIGGHSDAVEVLLALAGDRLNVNAKTKRGLTALHFASLTGNLEVAERIIEHDKANVNEQSSDGWTPLHLAIEFKRENVALELLSTNSTEVNIKGKDDLTPLHLAASSGQGNVVSELLDKGALIEGVDEYGYTPLHFAVESGDLNVVKRLAEKGANLYAEQKDGYTPLGLAAYNGALCIVQFLVNNKGVDINSRNKNGMSPIDFAASRDYFEIVEFLADKGAGQGDVLHWAAYGGHLNIVKYLVDERHFNSHKRDKYGNLPVHIAALQGHVDIVRYFIDQQQVDLNTENNNGYTPFLFAVLSGNADIIRYFIDGKDSSLNQSDNNGNTALHLAVLNSDLEVIRYLIRKGADISATDNYGNTPLFLATARGYLNLVKYFVQKEADFRAMNNYGNSLLHFAVWNGHLDIVQYFVEKGIHPNTSNKRGDTPIYFSTSLDITKYLIEMGAYFRLLGSDGCTPLHLAVANGQLDA